VPKIQLAMGEKPIFPVKASKRMAS
jgi:hypothetical protein